MKLTKIITCPSSARVLISPLSAKHYIFTSYSFSFIMTNIKNEYPWLPNKMKSTEPSWNSCSKDLVKLLSMLCSLSQCSFRQSWILPMHHPNKHSRKIRRKNRLSFIFSNSYQLSSSSCHNLRKRPFSLLQERHFPIHLRQ